VCRRNEGEEEGIPDREAVSDLGGENFGGKGALGEVGNLAGEEVEDE